MVLLLLASGCLPPSLGDQASRLSSGPETGILQPLSDELEVYPGPDSWISEALPTISLRLLDPSFVPEFQTSSLLLDGGRLIPNWEPSDRTVWATPREKLPDGLHRVEIDLRDSGQSPIQASWSFMLDSLKPRIDLNPLPLVADKRVISVNGTFVEENLEGIAVNGFPAIIEENAFRVRVPLWPGRTEIHVVAMDRAGNEGLGEAAVLWTPPLPTDQPYYSYAHENGRFIVEFPLDWQVHKNWEYDTGLVADIAAFGVGTEKIQPSVSVVSRPASRLLDEALLLGGLESAILTLGAQSEVEVISRPRFVDLQTGSLAAQFSVIQAQPEGARAFVVVTGYWSRPLSRIWMMVGTLDTLDVEAQWHVLQTAFETFQVVEPPAPPGGLGKAPGGVFQVPTLVTALAIVIIVTLFTVVMYLRRRARGPRSGE